MQKSMLKNFFDMDIGRAAANRHFIKDKGVRYTGDLIGPIGKGLQFQADTFKKAREDLEKMEDERKKYAERDLSNLTGDEKTKAKRSQMIAKYLAPILIKMAHYVVNKEEDKISASENQLRSISDQLQREQIPRNIIAKLIARFRSIYYKFMTNVKVGVYQQKLDQEQKEIINHSMNKTMGIIFSGDIDSKQNQAKLSTKQKFEMFKSGAKVLFKLGLNAVQRFLISVAGRILLLIDTLMQYLQNTANKFTKE